MISAAQDVADGNEGKGEHFAHQIRADLSCLNDFGFLAFAEYVVLSLLILMANGREDAFGGELFLFVRLAYRFGKSGLREGEGDGLFF